jgi:hypothetical protein
MSTQKKPTQSLITRQHVPFEKDVLKFLLEHEKNIHNPVVYAFVHRYVKWLYECVDQKVTILPGGCIELLRWTTPEGGSYGYDPKDIAYGLHILNEIFFTVMSNAYIRLTQQEIIEDLPTLNMQISIEVLNALAPGLGFYLLSNCFATDAPQKSREWLNRTCDIFGEFRDLEIWRPPKEIEEALSVKQVLASAQSPDIPYYHTAFPKHYYAQGLRNYQSVEAPSVADPGQVYKNSNYQQIYVYAYTTGYQQGYQQGHKDDYMLYVEDMNRRFSKAAVIIESERKRLVSFMKSLRQTLHVLNDDPLMVEDEIQVVTSETKATNGNRANTGDEEQGV